MGTKVEAPQPTAQEIALQQAQLDSIAKQNAETEAFKPYLYKQMGLREVNGQIQEIPWEERMASMAPQERAGYELNDLYLQRQKDAMEGKLPVSPAMEAELAQQGADLEANLSRRLGPQWSQSTPGIQSMTEFDKRAGLMREEARRGQISSGEGLLNARMGLLQNTQAQNVQQGQNWGLPAFSQLQGAYSQAYQPFQFNRNMQFQANQQSVANRMGLISGAMGMAGSIAGGGLGAGGRWGQKIG